MKRLLLGLFAVFVSGTTVHSASTDTVTENAVIDAKISANQAEIAKLIAQPLSPLPVENKVVEIHMSAAPVFLDDMSKRTRKTRIPTPLPYIRRGTCSGAFINDKGDILTAKHCVEDYVEFEVVTHDAKKYQAVVVATSTVHDLAIIHIDRRNTAFFKLADKVTRGERVWALGSPLGITDTLSTGVVARLDGDVTLIDCSALPGNSGGPLYNDAEELVGVVSAGYIVLFGVTHLNVTQGLDAVTYFIEKTFKERK